ncbi:bifunctional 4-hydroxy-3-methylbut-2-enyl diphosphate reductase/30S ribosomal protein S1 [Peptococcaceae bacterium 1198_IL3148]
MSSLEILIASKAGFCFGVKRAIEMAQQTAQDKNGPVYTYGPIIHNQQVVNKLQEQGINKIGNITDEKPGSLIIRSHGVEPQIFEEATKVGHEVIDATCPFVGRVQKLVRELAAEGYQVVIVGEKDHPEVQGIVGWSDGKALVVENAAEAEKITGYNRIGVVAQTTQPEANFNQVVRTLQNKGIEVKVCNTICSATQERQKAALELAQKVDVMIVVGGTNSANTGKLTKLCMGTGTTTYQIETAAELKAEWFDGVKRAGLTAGASTPSWVIEEVVNRMSELGEKMEGVQQETMQEGMNEAVEVKTLHKGELVTGTVVQINNDEVLVDVGAKSEGVIPFKELTSYNANPQEMVKVGDQIDVVVIKAEDEDGRTILSKERADVQKNWAKLQADMENGTVIDGTVREVVKGGLIVDVGVRAFLPASLVDIGYVEDLSQYLNETIKVRIIEMNDTRKKVVLSRKVVLEEEKAKQRAELFQTIEDGQTVKGIVRRLTDFGAFIDIGGIDGLLHISEMAWYRIKHPSEVVNVGDEIEVKILKVDKEKEKVSLGLKQVLPNPWDNVEEKYQVGSVVQAKVVRLAPFGAFVQLEPGVEGLVHISHLAEQHVEKPEDVVTEGEEIKVKVLSVDPEQKRIRLSIREVNREPKPQRQPKKPQEQKPVQYQTPTEDGTDGGGMTLGEAMPPEVAEMLKQSK